MNESYLIKWKKWGKKMQQKRKFKKIVLKPFNLAETLSK